MSSDVPPPAPAPGVLADMLARRSWDNDVSDGDRLLLEWASDTIRRENVEKNKALSRAEQWEAEAMTYAAILYGPNQKGGAA